MSSVRDRDVRRFYRAAVERSGDADILLRAGHTTGAVYLAGYAVECALKALLLAAAPAGDRAAVLASFRGTAAHDFARLLNRYRAATGRVTSDVRKEFLTVAVWSTGLRYDPAAVPADDARDFVAAARAILVWASRRLS